MRKLAYILLCAATLNGCSMTSSVMDTGGGTYSVVGQASPLRGGSEEAAHKEAVAFCARSGGHPVVLGNARPVFGNKIEMHFRCEG
jgi:hypothetical protein